MHSTAVKSFSRTAGILISLAASFVLSGCSGTSGSGVVPPPAAPVEFLYATSTNAMLAFSINPSTGALATPLVMAGPNSSIGLMASVDLGHVYVSDFLNDSVLGFALNRNTGALTPVQGSPFSLGGTPPGAGGLSPIVSTSSYVYATDLNANAVAGFLFDNPSGRLTPVPGLPFATGNTPVQAVQVGSPTHFLYVSNLNDSAGGISAFTIDSNTGALSPITGSPFPTGAPGSFPGPSAMVVSGDQRFLYVALAGTSNANNKIVAFAVDQATGSLSPITGSPFTTGNDPLYMAFVPNTQGSQGFLYTANIQDGTISAFTADNNTGVLTTVSGSPYSVASVGGLAVSSGLANSNTLFLYAADPLSQTIRAYSINGSTGALSPIAGSPFSAGGNSPMLLTIVLD